MASRQYGKDEKSFVTVRSMQTNNGHFDDLLALSAIPSAATSSSQHPYYGPTDQDIHNLYTLSDDKRSLVHSESPGSAGFLKPAPSNHPLDPLNLSKTRKIIACGFLCFFGAMAAAAELILGAMLPVFVLQYAGIDPKNIIAFADIKLPVGTDPLKLLASLPNAPPLEHIYLLGSLPVLFIGLTNLFTVPVATAVGRRPVILICGLIAIGGCVWAGNSQSLASHLLARCVQAVGAGTVESLIPFVISDLTFEHQRNTWMSFVFATQGFIIVGLGFSTPYIIIYASWRWLYFITAICAAAFLVGVFIFLPESRWFRSSDELRGIPGPKVTSTAKRTWLYDLAIFHGNYRFRQGLTVFTDALRTLFYPQILFITLLNSVMIGATFAAGFTAAPPLIVEPWAWPFFHLTLCLIPILIASLGTIFVTGKVADIVSNWGARRRPGGRRVPEDQLLNLMLPAVSGLLGTLLYGIAGGNPTKYSWAMFLAGLGLMAFGFLGCNTVGIVYVLECYPSMAGSALLNIASIRYIMAFFLSFKIADEIVDFGYAKSFMIYSICMAVFTAIVPVLWYFGPALKKKFPGRVTVV